MLGDEKSVELKDLRDDLRTKLIMLNGTLKISLVTLVPVFVKHRIRILMKHIIRIIEYEN